jgi:hypothetical protein
MGFFLASFRDGPKGQTRNPEVGEKNAAKDSGFDASHRPGMTITQLTKTPECP